MAGTRGSRRSCRCLSDTNIVTAVAMAGLLDGRAGVGALLRHFLAWRIGPPPVGRPIGPAVVGGPFGPGSVILGG